MKLLFPKNILPEERHTFYQSKYEYFEKVYRWIVVLMSLAEVSYLITDFQTFGRFPKETLIPRLTILLPLIAYYIFSSKNHNYKANTFFGYFIMHGCMWCTIWTIHFLPIRDFAREGFIIMHFGFLSLGLAVPVYLSTFLHALLLLDIVVSNLFNHYETFSMMITNALPVFVGIVLLQKILEDSYVDHYLNKKKLEQLSTKDQLTGAFNRNILVDLLQEGTAKLNLDSAGAIWFLLVDVDYFKKVNDSYGHESGDRILLAISDLIRRNIREKDYLLRWGGEEFVIILQNASKERAMQIGERIRSSIDESTFINPKVTVSIGVSSYQGDDYHQAINDADKAMYYAKSHGRNQVICVEDL